MTTREQRLRELVAKLRESANENWSTSQNKDWAEWVRDRANGECSGKRYAAAELEAILAEPVEVSEEFLGALTRIYAVGYLSGHEDTVEGRYTDVVYSDRTTYHRDVVNELLHDSDYAALNIKEPGQ